jgi:DNA-binding NarL/FixJ family response regulator
MILDYMMPDMDGVATLTEIRKINKKIAVIMFTAYPDMKSIKAAQDLNVTVYTPKLSSYEDLRASLETAIHSLEENA